MLKRHAVHDGNILVDLNQRGSKYDTYEFIDLIGAPPKHEFVLLGCILHSEAFIYVISILIHANYGVCNNLTQVQFA